MMYKHLLIVACVIISLSSCVDGAYYEKNSTIPNQSWSYDNIQKFEVDIDDITAKYDIYINLRHSADYDFSNIFVLFHEKGKGLKDTAYRKEIVLAQLDGRWLSNSAGGVYEKQYLAKENIAFPDTGKYEFAVEQNMRENPLKNIINVGIKLVKK
ncbi:gliding motility lipoprotein GldH [Sphingobacterium pedocola]|uniref:Gliding motility lipoprotein GldH n=1 Tax=Sphingobacterium pedocola TaxID=2082722 RepID=A0ABR9T8M8_9SPHI|nr:gliding motility lipoprotein GldH [Sphingobacterium pedocola]MBE8721444.1 gliding motility lipoprotein GldH [Sphingobacterium pedocola]